MNALKCHAARKQAALRIIRIRILPSGTKTLTNGQKLSHRKKIMFKFGEPTFSRQIGT